MLNITDDIKERQGNFKLFPTLSWLEKYDDVRILTYLILIGVVWFSIDETLLLISESEIEMTQFEVGSIRTVLMIQLLIWVSTKIHISMSLFQYLCVPCIDFFVFKHPFFTSAINCYFLQNDRNRELQASSGFNGLVLNISRFR